MSLDVDGTVLGEVLAPLAPGDPRPVWVQITQRVREAIEAGRFRQGQRLPTARRIGARYGVTSNVGYKALRRVAADGYATATGLRGYYVRGAPPDRRAP